MFADIKEKPDGSVRKIKIQMDNGAVFFLDEDVEKNIKITKEYGSDNGALMIMPSMSNQIRIK